jgi:hypothetical protein
MVSVALGATVGFACAVLIAVNTLHTPVGPILSTLLVGVGGLVGRRLSKAPEQGEMINGPNNCVLATPDSALMFILTQVSGAPDAERSTTEAALYDRLVSHFRNKNCKVCRTHGCLVEKTGLLLNTYRTNIL